MNPNDHRAIGQRLELFHLQEEAPGMVFWHPRGFALYQIIEDTIRRRMRAAGFLEVRTPQVLSRALWEASGHWQKFGANMFALEEGERAFALKPMSCPGHIQIFNKRPRSLRELPLRFCEFGACLRNEPSGGLLGLMRTRAFTQDDAHIFCTEAQVEAEVAAFCRLLRSIYRDFGFPEVEIRLATRPSERAGDDVLWDKAEAALAAAASAAGLDYALRPGEGAFYGPKLEFHLSDNRGRTWQCGTIQLDFVLPARLEAEYRDAENGLSRPVVIHHAVLGSLERFIGMLLEHYRGMLPLWLAPEQILVASIGKDQGDYAAHVAETLNGQGYRTKLDVRAEKLSKKIAEARASGIPLLAALGAREAANGTLSLRRQDGRQEVLPLAGVDDALRGEAFR